MKISQGAIVLLSFAAMLQLQASAQTDTVTVLSDVSPGDGALNNAVQEAINAGKLSSTVFRLEPMGRYVLSDTIIVPAGERLTIIAPEPGTTQTAAPPQILWTSNDAVSTALLFNCFGNITLKNVWLLFARTNGWQAWSSVRIADSPDTINGQHGDFEGVIFDYAGIGADGSGCVDIKARHFRGVFKNCYFRNCADPHFRYYGRAVSFPFGSIGWHIDSLSFENCTFANIGYVYMQEGGEYADRLWFNHCTFLNVCMFTFESGWWHWMDVSNSIFVNTFFYGDELGMRWPDTLTPYGGVLNIDSISAFGFSVPFTEAQRHILFTHSSYVLEEWLRDYMKTGFDGTLDSSWLDKKWWPIPQPIMSEKTKTFFKNKTVWPYVSSGSLYDSTDPGFIRPPTNVIGIKRFLYFKYTSGGADTAWAYNPQDDLNGVWPMKEDLSYTNQTLLTTGMGGFPLGDLYHWFPDKYAQWKTQQGVENARIEEWLRTGHDPGGSNDVTPGLSALAPPAFALEQNYPNPFNPSTAIRYSIPVGTRHAVSLQVFDVLGREVAVLANEQKGPGSYEVTFDGRGLSSGVYICRLKVGAFMLARTMVLVK